MPKTTINDLISWFQDLQAWKESVDARLAAMNAAPADAVWVVTPKIRLLGVPNGVVPAPAAVAVTWTGEAEGSVSVQLDEEAPVPLMTHQGVNFVVESKGKHQVALLDGGKRVAIEYFVVR